MKFSKLGLRMSADSGTLQLMRDLGDAMSTDTPPIMLGGGNPALIEEMQEIFLARLQVLAQDAAQLERTIAYYDDPKGDSVFLEAMADLLRDYFGWPIGPENIAITNGSQSAFFYLFNLFGGEHPDGTVKRIFLPLSPEYIGYADQGLTPDMFVAQRSRIELLDGGLFKYRVDLDNLEVPNDAGAIVVSRPTNPTGNVVTDDELRALQEIAAERDIPLIIDNAYGTPFPDIIFGDAKPIYSDHSVVCLSLSKLGLPGVRTGLVVAPEAVIEALGAMNAIVSLATNSIGPALVLDLVKSGDLVRVSRDIIRPFYEQRSKRALAWLLEEVAGLPCRVHKPEGAFFFWLWCEGLPISAQELYMRLKAKGVVVVAGHHFFPGLAEEWPHRHECLRISYAAAEDDLRRGLAIIGAEVRAAYHDASNA